MIFRNFFICLTALIVLNVSPALTQDSETDKQQETKAVEEQAPNRNEQSTTQTQNQRKNPGVEFVPSEDISEDTSVPFPVDI